MRKRTRVPSNYTADDFNVNCAPLETKHAVEKKVNMLMDFGFVNNKNEAAVRAWLEKLGTEDAMTRKLNPVVRFEKTLDEVIYDPKDL